jgi:hypothetical protein
MLLNEFIYYSNDNSEITADRRYDSSSDMEVVEKKDTRKIRLTLGQINKLRMASESHEAELESESGFIRQMYGQPAQEAQQQ